ncbi:MAG: molybdopterin molybdotransferase MoeA, partial [Lachnospiraceae bacterium]|nr:molybdopterin molybdotransferase MoeA [Lachnospiraceae bacterium]
IRLMTGAPIPEGSDAVCKYEDTDYTEEAVSLKREYRPGENIIRAGEDIKKGTLLIKAGSLIDAGMMGTMASLGVMKVKVCKRPLAGIISTGDELVDAASIPGPGMIRNSNRYTMAAALKGIGIDTVYLGHARDDTEETKRLIEKGEKCDIIISTGGVSAGDHDLVPDAMEEAGFEFLVRGVRIKPGMACAYGLKDGKLMLALSGNPASSLTNLQCICYPALKKLAGYRDYDHKLIKMKLKDECKKAGKGTRFLRGRLDIIEGGAFLAAPLDQGNVVISSAIGCNAYGILTDMRAPLLSGSVIEGFLV